MLGMISRSCKLPKRAVCLRSVQKNSLEMERRLQATLYSLHNRHTLSLLSQQLLHPPLNILFQPLPFYHHGDRKSVPNGIWSTRNPRPNGSWAIIWCSNFWYYTATPSFNFLERLHFQQIYTNLQLEMRQPNILATLALALGAYGQLRWVGLDESGAEWGTTFPGTEGVDYFFPSTTTIGVSWYLYGSENGSLPPMRLLTGFKITPRL